MTDVAKSINMRTILEAIIVAAMLWTGRSLVTLQTQVAVANTQLTQIQAGMNDLPSLRTTSTTQSQQILTLYQEMQSNRNKIEELQKLRGFK